MSYNWMQLERMANKAMKSAFYFANTENNLKRMLSERWAREAETLFKTAAKARKNGGLYFIEYRPYILCWRHK